MSSSAMSSNVDQSSIGDKQFCEQHDDEHNIEQQHGDEPDIKHQKEPSEPISRDSLPRPPEVPTVYSLPSELYDIIEAKGGPDAREAALELLRVAEAGHLTLAPTHRRMLLGLLGGDG